MLAMLSHCLWPPLALREHGRPRDERQRCERLHRLDNGAMRRPSRLSSFRKTPPTMLGKCSFASTAQSPAWRQSNRRSRACRWSGRAASRGQRSPTRHDVCRAAGAMRASTWRVGCTAMPMAPPRSSCFTICASSASRSRRALAAGPCRRRSGPCRTGRRQRRHLAPGSTQIGGHRLPRRRTAET